MKHFFFLFLLLALLPLCAQAEIILFEDENGKVIMSDDGEIEFLPPDENMLQTAAPQPAPTPTPIPAQQERLIETYQLHTPLPTPTLEPFTYSRKLEYGVSGDLVKRLQDRLRELGFYDAKSSGGYYEITQKAVRAFQKHNGLSADGVAGRQTQEMLFSGAAVPAYATPRPSPTPAPAKYTLMVDRLNQIVRAYTYDESGNYTVLVREMICSTGTKKNPTPLGTTIMPSKRARWGYFPTWDSHAQYLTRIDSANAFHSVLYYFADETQLAMQSYEDLGSPASHGCVRLYVGERSLPAPTPTPTYSRENWPTKYRTLYRGRSGEDVFMLQMRLRELGYYNGTVTGGYYGGTIKAVENFQRDHGLTVDGAAGEKTQALLFSSSVEPAADESASPAADITTPIPTLAPTATPVPERTPLPAAAPMLVPEYVPRAPIEDSVG